VAVGDFNADGTPDLAVANLGSNTVSILLGAGGGSFGAATSFAVGSRPFSVAVVGSEEALPLLARVTWFAKSVGIPYVPVTPTFPWLGPLGLVPLPSKWRIKFGEPLDVAGEYGPEAADDRLLVGRLSEQVRAQVQAMVDELRG
jgi:hypothetical protein